MYPVRCLKKGMWEGKEEMYPVRCLKKGIWRGNKRKNQKRVDKIEKILEIG